MQDDQEIISNTPISWLPSEVISSIASLLGEKDLNSFLQMRASCRFFGSSLQHILLRQIANKIPKDIIIDNHHFFIVHSDGTVSCCGKNENGQLGLGETTNVDTIQNIPNLNNVKKICTESNQTIFIKQDGSLLICGMNLKNLLFNQELNDNGENQDLTIPTPPPHYLSEKISDAVLCEYLSMLFIKDNKIYGFGINRFGQLGSRENLISIPTEIAGLTDVLQLSCSNLHTLFLTKNGDVWGSGSNCSGQLGLGDMRRRETPVHISELSGIQQVAAGKYYSVFLKKNGTAWICGAIGKLKEGSPLTIPTQIPDIDHVVQVATQGSLVILVKQDGTVWSYANSVLNECGLELTTEERVLTQISIADVSRVVMKNTTTLFFKHDGSIWGIGDLKLFGIESIQETPILIPSLNKWYNIYQVINSSFLQKSQQDENEIQPCLT